MGVVDALVPPFHTDGVGDGRLFFCAETDKWKADFELMRIKQKSLPECLDDIN